MNKKSLFLSVEVVESASIGLDASNETRPFLAVFLSRHVTSVHVVEEFDLPAQGRARNVDLQWTDTRTSIDGRHAAIGFQLYAHLVVENERGQTFDYLRREPLAKSVFYLSRLLLLTPNTASSYVDLRLVDRSDSGGGDPMRTVVRIRLRSSVVLGGAEVRGKFLQSQQTREAADMERVVENFLRVYQNGQFQPAIPQAWNMHIPMFRTSTFPIPAAFYRRIGPTQGMDCATVRYLISVSLRLQGWNEQSFLAVLRGQMKQTHYDRRCNLVAKVIGDALTFSANCSDYMTDHNRIETTERFKIVRARLYAGDCEDVAKEIELVATSMAKVVCTRDSDPMVYYVVRFLKLYVIVMNTALAMTPSLQPPVTASGEAGREDDDTEYICHIYTTAIPRWKFLARCKGASFVRGVRDAMQREVPELAWEKELPTLILEGTNWSTCLQAPLALYAEERSRSSIIEKQRRVEVGRIELERDFPGLRALGVQIQQSNIRAASVYDVTQQEFSNFYRWVVNAWADLSKYGLRTLDFTVCDARRGDRRYGVDFRDWVTMSERIQFVSTYEMTEAQWMIATNAMDKEAPIPQLRSDRFTTRGDIASLRALSQRYPPPPPPSTTSPGTPGVIPYVPGFIVYRSNHENKITPSVVSALDSALASRRITALEHRVHSASEDGELYLIEIRVYLSSPS